MKPGEQFLLPCGVRVMVAPPPANLGLAWSLLGPGSWGRWAVDQAGAVVRIEPDRKTGVVLRSTGWRADDLLEWE